VAVPLSSLILVGEIFLCGLFFITPVARFSGQVLGWMIGLMNQYIELLARIPYCTWKGLSVSFSQAVLLLIFVAGFSYWLLEKSRAALWATMVSLFAFLLLRSLSFREVSVQRQLIVYHVQKHRAIDVLYGRNSCFIGDTAVLQDIFLFNFSIRPSRIMHRIKSGSVLTGPYNDLMVGRQHVLLLDSTVNFITLSKPEIVDLLIFSHNPKISIPRLCRSFVIRQVVIDASVPAWKAARWKKDFDSLQIPCHDVVEKGAFVVDF
jgi:competence protein ComEC